MSAMRETLEVTLAVTGALERLGVRYVVGGSLASSLHGFPRATQDVDIVADLSEADVPRFVAALAPEFYLDEDAIRSAVRDRASFNVIHLKTLFKADVFVAKDDEPTRSELARRQRYRLPADTPGALDLASPEDVVVQKLHWYRLGDHVSERQWADAQSVLTVRGRDLDLAYMRRLGEIMEVPELLERALAEAGIAG